MNRKEHWESVYVAKSDAEVSWTQLDPRVSLSLITQVCPPPGPVIDVGGGTSALTAHLLDGGYDFAVVDLRRGAVTCGGEALDAGRSGSLDRGRCDGRSPSGKVWIVARPGGVSFPNRHRRPRCLCGVAWAHYSHEETCDHRHVRAGWSGEVQRARGQTVRRALSCGGGWSGMVTASERTRNASDTMGKTTVVSIQSVSP